MELATFKFGVGIQRTITTKRKKIINEKETGKHQKFPKKNSLFKKIINEKERANGQKQ